MVLLLYNAVLAEMPITRSPVIANDIGDDMNLGTFKASLEDNSPPAGVSLALRALWHEAKGAWDAAHKLAQAQDDAIGAWVHAYLHRVEGDETNAGHWYRRADKTHSTATHSDEWDEIAAALCKNSE